MVEEAGEVGGRLEGRDRRMKRKLRGLRDKKEIVGLGDEAAGGGEEDGEEGERFK